MSARASRLAADPEEIVGRLVGEKLGELCDVYAFVEDPGFGELKAALVRAVPQHLRKDVLTAEEEEAFYQEIRAALPDPLRERLFRLAGSRRHVVHNGFRRTRDDRRRARRVHGHEGRIFVVRAHRWRRRPCAHHDRRDRGVNAQASAVFQVGTPATDLRDVALHARVKLSDATNTELFLGFAATDTTILAGVTDSLGWRKAAGSTDLKGVIESSSTETLTAALATAGTSWVRLGCYLEAANARVMFTVNGALVHEEKTLSNLPSSTLLAPSIAFRTSAAATKTLDIDWLHLWQGGR